MFEVYPLRKRTAKPIHYPTGKRVTAAVLVGATLVHAEPRRCPLYSPNFARAQKKASLLPAATPLSAGALSTGCCEPADSLRSAVSYENSGVVLREGIRKLRQTPQCCDGGCRNSSKIGVGGRFLLRIAERSLRNSQPRLTA
jgi:hypothetical protein